MKHRFQARIFPVNLVDDDDDLQVQFKRFLKHKLRQPEAAVFKLIILTQTLT